MPRGGEILAILNSETRHNVETICNDIIGEFIEKLIKNLKTVFFFFLNFLMVSFDELYLVRHRHVKMRRLKWPRRTDLGYHREIVSRRIRYPGRSVARHEDCQILIVLHVSRT